MPAVVGVPARKNHKKIIYKYIDLHMPVTLKRAGGATRLPSPDFHPRAHSYHCRPSYIYIRIHIYIYIYATRIEGTGKEEEDE